MYPLNEPELQKLHREEVIWEVERARLARRLREERTSGVRDSSLDRVMTALRTAFGREAKVGDCDG
ncbi:MAG: hypothetical protein ACRDSJ_07915 [Rubrobacteraceae bacterium]